MNWRILLPLPIAALAVGTPLQVPKLRSPLPLLEKEKNSCAYSKALHRYLEAYAYARENRNFSARLLAEVENELARCGENAEPLRRRAAELRKALFPEEDKFPRPHLLLPRSN